MLMPKPTAGSSREHMASDDIRARLQAACTDLQNTLFDRAAMTSSDAQHHARTLRWLRWLREHGESIIDDLQGELVRFEGTRHALDARRLRPLLARHFALLDPDQDESMLIEATFSRRLLHATPTVVMIRAPSPDATTSRMIERLHMGAHCLPADRGTEAHGARTDDTTPATADTGGAPCPIDTPRHSPWRTALLSLSALALLLTLGPPEPRSDPHPPGSTGTVTLPLVASPLAPSTAPAHESPSTLEATATTATPPIGQEMLPTELDAANEVMAIDPPPAADSDLVTAPDEPAPTPPPSLTPATDTLAAAADPRLALQVEFLLQRAASALAALHLSEPFPDSAAANYTAVLALDPGNPLAHEGLERVVSAYGALLESALANGNLAYADTLLQRARTVQPASALLVNMDQAIAAARGSAR